MSVKETEKGTKIFSEPRRTMKSFVNEREVYRILFYRYVNSPAELPPKEVIRLLRNLFTYRQLSEHQLRRLVRSTLRDPLVGELLKVELNAPTDWILGDALRSALPNLREVVVIPTFDPIEPSQLPIFLGRTAARIFLPRLLGGQCVGIGYGPAIHAFVKSLLIPHFLLHHLSFEALAFFADTNLQGIGSENLLELVSNHSPEGLGSQLKGLIRPTELKFSDLHWAFIEINAVSDRSALPPLVPDAKTVQKYGAVAEILGQLIDRNGAILPCSSPVQATPLTVLRDMVRNGRGVVALVGGAQSVSAVLASYRAGLFNYLVTDEVCAELLLKTQHPNWRASELPYRDEWWERKLQFYVAFMRYGQPSLYHTIKDISQSLTITPKRVRSLLNNLHKGGSHEPMITIRIKAPSPEMELEMQLIRLFGLCEARVATYGRDDVYYALGNAAAQLFWELAHTQRTFNVGIGSGQEIRAMLRSLNLPTTLGKIPHIKSLSFWALTANPVPKVIGLSAETVLASTAMECSGKLKSPKVQFHTYRGGRVPELDVAFVEISTFAPNEIVALFARELGISLEELSQKSAGSILLQFFNDDGTILTELVSNQVMTFPLTELQKMVQVGKPVVIVAGGAHKAFALLAAYKGKLFNSLVVDRPLAEALLSSAYH